MTDFLSTHRRERLKRHLDEIPDLMAYVETAAATLLPRRGQQGGSRPTPGSRPPVNLTVVDLRDQRGKHPAVDLMDDRLRVHNEHLQPYELTRLAAELDDPRRRGVLQTLGEWVRLASGEMLDAGEPCTDPAEEPTIVSEAGWLSMHLGWIVQQQWVNELEQDIRRIHRDLQTVIGEGRPEYRPRCPNCRGRMDDEGAYFTCRDCGHQVRDQAMDHRTALANESPMSAYDFAVFGVMPERIRKWVERGDLQPAVGDDGQVMKRGKRLLYHPLDVLRLKDTRDETGRG